MSVSSVLIIIAAIIMAVVIIRLITKILAKIIAIILIFAVAGYFLFYWNGGVLNLGEDSFILYELQEEYCIEKADTIICECAIMVLLEDIQEQYTTEELLALTKDKTKSIKVVLESLRKNSDQISGCLKENDSGLSLEELKNKIVKLDLGQRIKDLLGDSDSDQ